MRTVTLDSIAMTTMVGVSTSLVEDIVGAQAGKNVGEVTASQFAIVGGSVEEATRAISTGATKGAGLTMIVPRVNSLAIEAGVFASMMIA